MLKYALFLVSITCTSQLWAQPFQAELFKLLCNEIVKDNALFHRYESCFDAPILIDPITYETIDIPQTDLDALGFECWKNLKSADRLHYQSLKDIPIFPLKDTIIIIDSSKTLPLKTYNENDIYITVQRKVSPSQSLTNSTLIYYYASQTRDNVFMIAFSFPGEKVYYTFHCPLLGEKLNGIKSKVVYPNICIGG
jgi:hypothetical protein